MWGLFKRAKPTQVNAAELAPLNVWLRENGFDPDEVSFSIYRDENLLKTDSTILVVGFGKSGNTTSGYVVECNHAQIVDSAVINPGAASYHKQLSAKALYSGTRLFHILVSKSLEFNSR